MAIAAKRLSSIKYTPTPETPETPETLIETLGTIEFNSSWAGTLGWEFEVKDVALNAKSLLIYLPSKRTTNVHLWRSSTTGMLASVEIESESDQWVKGLIPEISLSPNTRYIISINFNSESYYRSDSPPSNYILSDKITYITGRWTSLNNAFPNNTGNRFYGIVDLEI